jgi:hypothetical protein
MDPQYNQFITTSVGAIRSQIQGEVDSANSAIRSAVDGFNKANPFGDIKVPQFAIPSVGSLDGLKLPDTFTGALTSLRDNLPTVAQLKDEVEGM